MKLRIRTFCTMIDVISKKVITFWVREEKYWGNVAGAGGGGGGVLLRFV